MKSLFAVIGIPFARLPFCSLPGAVAGSFAGFLVTIFETEMPNTTLTPQQLAVMGVLFGAAGWLLILVLFGLILRYGVASIFWPSLVNALITALLTVFASSWLHVPAANGLTGLLIGIGLGAVLCWFCGLGQVRSVGKT